MENNKDQDRKPSSYLASKTQKYLKDSIKELGGLDELSIKALHFFLTEMMKLEKYRLSVLYKEEPKQIVIHAYSHENKKILIKPKNDKIFKALAVKIGVPDYVIRFAEYGEDYEE